MTNFLFCSVILFICTFLALIDPAHKKGQYFFVDFLSFKVWLIFEISLKFRNWKETFHLFVDCLIENLRKMPTEIPKKGRLNQIYIEKDKVKLEKLICAWCGDIYL